MPHRHHNSPSKKTLLKLARAERKKLAMNARKRFVCALYSDNFLPVYIFLHGPSYRYLSVKHHCIKSNLGEVKLISLSAYPDQARNSCEELMKKIYYAVNTVLGLEFDLRVMSLETWFDDMMESK